MGRIGGPTPAIADDQSIGKKRGQAKGGVGVENILCDPAKMPRIGKMPLVFEFSKTLPDLDYTSKTSEMPL